MKAAAVLKSWVRNAVMQRHRSQLSGICWYLVKAKQHRSTSSGPFNGQSVRQALFQTIIARTRPRALVETGTFLGTTTEYLAQTGLPVFTIEADTLYCGYSRARLWRDKRVRVIRGDSRSALRALAAGPLGRLADSPLFFYLDAHWNADLPLAEEIDIVLRQWPAAIVMIDDFRVPGDPGYGYDDYGPGNMLDLSYLGAAIVEHGLAVYFPSTPSAAETGARCGCVVLAKKDMLGCVLDRIPLLTRHAGPH